MQPPRSADKSLDPFAMEAVDLDRLATAPDMIRWDLGERSTRERPPDRLCVFRIDRLVLAFSGAFSRGIETLSTATPIPLAPSHVVGLVHVRGQIVPLISIQSLLLPRPPRRKTLEPDPAFLALALRVGEIDLCWMIDEVLGFEPFDLSTLDTSGPNLSEEPVDADGPEPPAVPSRWILGTADLPGHGVVSTLDMVKVVDELRIQPAAPEALD